jgi:holo-[acyl-carrier protein] synthase
MDIIGTGLDATEIDRVEAMIARYGDRFVTRIFTDGEIAYCRRKRNSVESFAARFAAKEAGMKALGTGHTHGVLWKSVEVVRGAGGPPQLRFHDAALRRFQMMGGTRTLLTLTHSGPLKLALAHVLLIKD